MSRVRGGRIGRALSLAGRWGVPVITEDGGAGGLSADSKTLVLFRITRAYPRRRSTFSILVLADPGARRRNRA